MLTLPLCGYKGEDEFGEVAEDFSPGACEDRGAREAGLQGRSEWGMPNRKRSKQASPGEVEVHASHQQHHGHQW